MSSSVKTGTYSKVSRIGIYSLQYFLFFNVQTFIVPCLLLKNVILQNNYCQKHYEAAAIYVSQQGSP